MAQITNHCDNCDFKLTNLKLIDFEAHLNSHEPCLEYYKTKFKKTNIDEILINITRKKKCLMCSPGSSPDIRLHIHLEKNADCLRKYLDRFNKPNKKELLDFIEKSSRGVAPSRKDRILEYEKSKNKIQIEKQILEENKTDDQRLSKCRLESIRSNYITCIVCMFNFSETDAVVEVPEKDIPDFIKDKHQDELNKLKRCESFYVCNRCKENNFKQLPIPSTKEDVLEIAETDGTSTPIYTLFPKLSAARSTKTFDGDLSNTVLFKPDSPHFLKKLPLTLRNEVQKKYKAFYYDLDKINFENMEQLIFLSMKQYNTCMEPFLYEGSVSQINARKVEIIKKDQPKALKIKGSRDWESFRKLENNFRIDQLGLAHLSITILFPLIQDRNIATILMQQNKVVTTKSHENSSLVTSITYFVCVNHEADAPCIGEDCPKEELNIYLEKNSYTFKDKKKLVNSYISSYISLVEKMMLSFIKNFLKSSNSSLYSENYHFEISYLPNGEIIVHGVIWPKELGDLNDCMNQPTINLFDIGCGKKHVLDRIITTTDSQTDLQERFKLAEFEAKSVINLVNHHQIRLLDDNDDNFPYPSLLTLPKYSPDIEYQNNVSSSKSFRRRIREIIMKNRTYLFNSNLPTAQWIRSLFEVHEISGDVIMIVNGNDCIRFLQKDPIYLKLREIFESDDLLALYHLGILCYESGKEAGPILGEFIIKRENMKHLFIEAYNPHMLRLFESRVNTQPENYLKYSDKLKQEFDQKFEDNIPDEFNDYFKRSTITEAVMNVKNSRMDYNNHSCIYVPLTLKEKFKKTYKKTPTSLEDTQDPGIHFERVFSLREKYYMRKNGRNLLLAELAVHYNLVRDDNQSKQKELYNRYSEDLEEIEDTETKAVMGNEFLPKYILLENGEVFQFSNSTKVLTYNETNKDTEVTRIKVMLFYPHCSEDEIKRNFESKLTFANLNERKLFKRKLHKQEQ